MSDVVVSEQLRRIPLFSGIPDAAFADLLPIFEPVSYVKGARLTRQGESARGALFIERGEVEVRVALPGGGGLPLALLGGGSVIGEMSLLERGTCSATVMARTGVNGFFVERADFRALIAQRNEAAFKLQHGIAVNLCRKIRYLNDKLVACNAPENPVCTEPLPGGDPLAGVVRARTCSFDYRAFLPVLPAFCELGSEDVDDIATRAPALELPRGQYLFVEGQPTQACYIVIRGAVEVSARRDGRAHRLGIVGPGHLCGHMGLIDGVAHAATARVRENAVLMELDRALFGALYRGSLRVCVKFQQVVNRNLLEAFARTNIELTRVVSQARIRGAGPGAPAGLGREDLEFAVGQAAAS